jgi:hypothetical protein
MKKEEWFAFTFKLAKDTWSYSVFLAWLFLFFCMYLIFQLSLDTLAAMRAVARFGSYLLW